MRCMLSPGAPRTIAAAVVSASASFLRLVAPALR